MPKLLKIVFRILSIIILVIAIISLLSFCVQLYFYYKTNIWRPFLTLGFVGLGFIGFYALWGYKKWTVVIFGINFVNVLLIQLLRSIYLGKETCCSGRDAIAILLSGGILLFAYFSRHHLNGIYLKWLPILLFVGFVLLSQISQRYLLGVQ